MGKTKKDTPKTYSIRLSTNALQNIDDITGFIAFVKHEPQSAMHVGDEIFATIEKIGKSPYAFRECEEIPTSSKMYRKAVCMSWLVIYRIIANEIIVHGVIHSSRVPSRIKQLRKIK